MRDYREKLKKFHPIGFEKYIKWQQVMAVWAVVDELNLLRRRAGIGSWVRAMKEGFCDSFRYQKSGDEQNNVMLFYGRYNYRTDHYKTFSNLVSSLENVWCMNACPVKKKVHFLRGIKLFAMNTVWFFQALFACKNIVCAGNVAYPVTLCYLLKRELEKAIADSGTKLFISYYDASPDENFAVQVAKHYGKVTATLQHGIFARKEPCKVLSDTGFEYSDSIADYYLAWNEYTRDEWLKMQLDVSKLRILGIPKYINFVQEAQADIPITNVFGVMLNNGSFKEHNIRLIQMANIVAKLIGKKYVLRYHPSLKEGAYMEHIDEMYFAGKSDNAKSIYEYSQTVEFTIISSSSVFVDLLYLRKPVYRLKVHDNDTYANVKYNSFETADELVSYLNGQEDTQSVFEYLCTTDKVKEKYQKFIYDVLEE